MVKVSDHDEPMGDAKPWDEVVLDDFRGTVDGGSVSDTPNHGKDTEVGSDDRIALGRVEQDRVGIKVVSPLGIRLLTRDVEEKIGRESEDLLTDKHVKSVKRCIPKVMIPIDIFVATLRNTEIRTCFRDVDFIFLHRSMV